MKKLNPAVILITSVITLVVLFGGWFTYQHLALKSPLVKLINEQPSVEDATIKLNDNELDVDLKVTQDINIREFMNTIYKEGQSYIGSRNVNLHIEEQSSPAIEAWWSSTLFDVAEAMELKQYSRIPTTLQNKAGELPGLGITTDIDEKNVYIKLTHQEAVKIIILPRMPNKMEVFANA